jgi:proline iminopeptidase
MLIQGVFTGSEAELHFVEQGLFQRFFPDVWTHYLENTPKAHRSNPTAYHFGRILGDDPDAAMVSAHLFSTMEGSLMSLDDRFTPQDFATFDPAPTKIEVHYFVNRCFLPNRYVLINAHKLTMPVWIVQGRYDFVCPPQTAYDLHRAISGSTLIWTMAGHGNDRSNYDVMRTLIAQW